MLLQGFKQPLIVNGMNNNIANTTISGVKCKMICAFLEDHKSEAYF